MTLISFDIDGTMTFGDPPGPLTVELVRRCRSLGYRIGSGSDRTERNQWELWRAHGIELDFVSLKHRLGDVRGRFEVTRFIHIGDTEMDQYFARQAGFEFWFADKIPAPGSDGWIL
jgi:hypothetical protein